MTTKRSKVAKAIARLGLLALVGCAINIAYAGPRRHCVMDPAQNESTCNYEARMTVAKLHGFAGMAHSEMSQAIEAIGYLDREFSLVYKACMRKHNYCEYSCCSGLRPNCGSGARN